MTVTPKLKAHVVAKGWAVADASDEQILQVVGNKLTSQEISAAEWSDFLETKAADPKALVASLVQAEVAKATEPLTKQIGELVASLKGNAAAAAQTAKVDQLESQIDQLVSKSMAKIQQPAAQAPPASANANQVMGKAAQLLGTDLKTVHAHEQYSTTRSKLFHPDKDSLGYKHLLAGRPVSLHGRDLELPSDFDKAMGGAYLKWAVNVQNPGNVPHWLRLTQHDQEIMQYALREKEWTGYLQGGDDAEGPSTRWINHRRLSDLELKTLLDESGSSGGVNLAPVAFDDAIIQYPLLYGQFAPFVETIEVARGRQIVGSTLLNPTLAWGTAEGTGISEFSTTAFAAAFNTNIWPCTGAMTIGMDLEDDSPVKFGDFIVKNFGFQWQAQMDKVICLGNGTDRPQGFFNASGTNTITSDFGGVPPSVSDMEGLMFGIGLQYRSRAGSNCVYASNDTSYAAVRGIEVNPTDQRRVFGMTHQDYKVLEVPFKIQNDIPDGQYAFLDLAKYRMYRRLGLQVRIETAGVTLAKANERAIIVRARIGGRLTDGSACAVMNVV